VDVTTRRMTPRDTMIAAPSPTIVRMSGGILWIPAEWRHRGNPVIPNRWLSESRHVGYHLEYCRPRGGGSSPSASGSEDVLRVAPIRPRTGLRWARSTDADGEGDVREARATESAPTALDKGPLIDGVPGTCLSGLPHVKCRIPPRFQASDSNGERAMCHPASCLKCKLLS
jgi:hypothetical protein